MLHGMRQEKSFAVFQAYVPAGARAAPRGVDSERHAFFCSQPVSTSTVAALFAPPASCRCSGGYTMTALRVRQRSSTTVYGALMHCHTRELQVAPPRSMRARRRMKIDAATPTFLYARAGRFIAQTGVIGQDTRECEAATSKGRKAARPASTPPPKVTRLRTQPESSQAPAVCARKYRAGRAEARVRAMRQRRAQARFPARCTEGSTVREGMRVKKSVR